MCRRGLLPYLTASLCTREAIWSPEIVIRRWFPPADALRAPFRSLLIVWNRSRLWLVSGPNPLLSRLAAARWAWCCADTTLSIFLLGSNAAPEFSLRRALHSPLLTVLGEPHGRNLASALMRSRVHNRTSDRGGKPIRLAWPWALPPVLPEGPGALSPKRN